MDTRGKLDKLIADNHAVKVGNNKVSIEGKNYLINKIGKALEGKVNSLFKGLYNSIDNSLNQNKIYNDKYRQNNSMLDEKTIKLYKELGAVKRIQRTFRNIQNVKKFLEKNLL